MNADGSGQRNLTHTPNVSIVRNWLPLRIEKPRDNAEQVAHHAWPLATRRRQTSG